MFVLDIESVPNDDMLGTFDRYHKDAYTTEHGLEGYEKFAVGQMSLLAPYAKVAGLGFWIDGELSPVSVMAGDVINNAVMGEEILLKKFWSLMKNHAPCVGFNIINFDVKVIRHRSMALGIAPLVDLREIKPWERDKLRDLAHLLYPDHKRLSMKESFDALCPHVEIPERYKPVLEFNGAMVYDELKKDGGIDTVRLYQEYDVWREMMLQRQTVNYF